MSIRAAHRISALLLLGCTAFAQTSKSGSKGGAAPEIDVSLGIAAVALVLGGILILTATRRKRLARS